ncbi:MAG TPA: hypothetical protein VIR82_22735 [Bradyrhizobium sp.]
MVQSTIGQVLTNIEREIQAEVHNAHQPRQPGPIDFVTPMTAAPAMAMPDYVEHRDGATEIGRLSAEAVVREYEAAAKDIEALGAELIERVKQCEAMSRDVLRVTGELKETANRYREEAKRVFIEIESCSKMTSEVSKICGELRDRIAPPAAADKSKTKKARAAV